jgi:hypothetical protein
LVSKDHPDVSGPADGSSGVWRAVTESVDWLLMVLLVRESGAELR